jgi:hypothetical protein
MNFIANKEAVNNRRSFQELDRKNEIPLKVDTRKHYVVFIRKEGEKELFVEVLRMN